MKIIFQKEKQVLASISDEQPKEEIASILTQFENEPIESMKMEFTDGLLVKDCQIVENIVPSMVTELIVTLKP